VARLGVFDQQGTHRLIPTAYTTESVLETLSLPANVISDLTELDAATNERKISEHGGNAAISPGELLYGVPEAHFVNAAFTHPGPFGGRFNDSRRGALLKDSRISEPLSFDYADFLADFSGQFHFLDDAERQQCLQPGPIPGCYGPSQALAGSLLYSGSSGIVYPSVRRAGGTCIACFRPALVFHPHRGRLYHITVAAMDDMTETRELLS